MLKCLYHYQNYMAAIEHVNEHLFLSNYHHFTLHEEYLLLLFNIYIIFTNIDESRCPSSLQRRQNSIKIIHF